MKPAHLTIAVAFAALISASLLSWLRAEDSAKPVSTKPTAMEISDKAPAQPAGPVQKTEEQWRKDLTPEQYRILREAGTERANGKVYEEFKAQGAGTYYCAGCNAELFTSKEKFDSHCGWPSFYDPAKAKNVKTSVDFVLGYPRTEVKCAVCDGHLGHVFEGEGFDTPTDKRYCINGTVLKFVPQAEVEAAKKKAGEAAKAEGDKKG
jgi:peptide-methionine (R)-S-oxide reductase